ncbi:hypothetical protein CR513_62539, partial [Mucuna pruriens]
MEGRVGAIQVHLPIACLCYEESLKVGCKILIQEREQDKSKPRGSKAPTSRGSEIGANQPQSKRKDKS